MAYAMELCGRKYQKANKLLLDETVASGPSSFAKRQLELMGWKEGEGLGKDKQGLSTHIKVAKRKEEEGLGHDVNVNAKLMYEDQWWNSSLNATLAKFQSNKKQKKRKTNTDQQVIITTDEQLFAATGGARFGMRAQSRAEGKWARTENTNELTISLEQKAQMSMEWNGLGNAKVLLTSTTATTSSQVIVKKSKKHKVKQHDLLHQKTSTNAMVKENVNHPLHKKTSVSKLQSVVGENDSVTNQFFPETSSKNSGIEQQLPLVSEKKKKKKSKKKEKKQKRTSKVIDI